MVLYYNKNESVYSYIQTENFLSMKIQLPINFSKYLKNKLYGFYTIEQKNKVFFPTYTWGQHNFDMKNWQAIPRK